jgi:hypothetical protein
MRIGGGGVKADESTGTMPGTLAWGVRGWKTGREKRGRGLT